MSCLPTIHFFTLQLISAVDPKFLKLTKSDDQIYTKFREAFPDLSIQVLDPTLLKSDEAKEVWKAPTYVILDLKSWDKILRSQVLVLQKWRPFCNQFDGIVEDFNYGTLLRIDCQKDYTEENTIFGMYGVKCTRWT